MRAYANSGTNKTKTVIEVLACALLKTHTEVLAEQKAERSGEYMEQRDRSLLFCKLLDIFTLIEPDITSTAASQLCHTHIHTQ